MSNKTLKSLGIGVIVFSLSLLGYYGYDRATTAAASLGNLWYGIIESDHQDGRTYQIIDEQNQMLSQMSRTVNVGDELITGAGRHYRVQRVDGQKASAEFIGMDQQMLAYLEEYEDLVLPAVAQKESVEDSLKDGWAKKPIALYHTHSAESYVPSDGTDSKPYEGGIFDVGNAIAEELKKLRVNVIHDKTPHDPRDTNAYYRSRRTAATLMQENPVTIIDVHRDGIPDPAYYSTNIEGQEATQLRLVVGRQNPKMQTNEDFAKKVMAYVNKVHDGLVKEIFIAKGNYNQDLMSTAMLVEVGTHTNTKEAAEKGAVLFASALPGLLGLTTGSGEGNGAGTGGYTDAKSGSTGAGSSISGIGWKNIALLIGIVLLGGFIFLLINSGSGMDIRKKISTFWSQELGSLSPMKKVEAKKTGKSTKPPG